MKLLKLPGRINRLASSLLAVMAITLIGVSLGHLTYAASGSLSLNPSSGGVTVGNNLTVTMHENSGSDAAAGADAWVNYPANLLQFVSATTVAPFTAPGPDTPSGGTIEIIRGSFGGPGVTGDQVVTTLTFKVLAAGTGTVTFNNSKSSIAAASNGANLLVTSSGGSYTLSTPVTPPPPPPPTPTPTPTPTPAPAPVTGNAKSTSISVKGSSGGSSGGSGVTVPNNGSVAVTAPISIEPTTVQSDGVSKVEYYLGGKLVDTETKPPYKYNINTTKLKNGSYNLVSKTYYTNGTTKQATQHLIVKNAAAQTKSSLWLYFLLIGVVILIVLGVNFIGPSAGDPFKRLFKRYTLPPLSASEDSDIHSGPLPPVSGGPTASASTITMPSVSPPVNSGHISSVAPGATVTSQPGNTSVHHLQPPAHPSPGTVFAPSSKDD